MSSDPETKQPHNPWRESLQNCIDGSNYLRRSEYHELVAYIDGLLAERDAALEDAERYWWLRDISKAKLLFAEVVADECARVAESCDIGPCPNVATQRARTAAAIRSHFGVDSSSAAPAAQPGAIENLRALQASSVMPLIGPLLDAWDGMPGDIKSMVREEAPNLVALLGSISGAMEGRATSETTVVVSREVLRDALAALGLCYPLVFDHGSVEHVRRVSRAQNAISKAIWANPDSASNATSDQPQEK